MTSRRTAPVILAALLVGRFASAQQSPAEVARRDLLEQADAARASGDHPRALELARRAAQIRMTTSLRLLLAQEHEATGDHVAALDHATACVREAEADAALRNRDQLLDVCRALVASVTPRVGSLVVRIDAPPAGLVVRVAGHEVSPALYGVPFPVAPGEVVVEVGGEGVGSSHETVRVTAGERAEVTPRVRVVERAAQPTRTGVDPRASMLTTTSSRGPGAGPWVLVGVGGAALVGAAVSFVVANGAQQSRDRECVPGCRTAAEEYDRDYRTWAYVGDAALAVGAVGVVSGVLWAVLGRGRSDVQVAVVPTASGATLGVGGAL